MPEPIEIPTLSEIWGQIVSDLPDRVIGGAELCALPGKVDDDLAKRILHEVGELNGTTPRVLSELKHLPFVVEVPGAFEFSPQARATLVGRLKENQEAFQACSRLLSDVLGARYHIQTDKQSARARGLQWNYAFHLAPVDAKETVSQLDMIMQRASSLRSVADMRAIVELTGEQQEWLGDHAIDILYYEGRLAYEQRHFREAEKKLQLVWGQSSDIRKKIASGHCLGTIWANPDRGNSWSKGVAVLEATGKLAEDADDQVTLAMVLITLGALRLRRGLVADSDQAIDELRSSARISSATGHCRTEVYARTALASALIKLGDRDSLNKAEEHLRIVIDLEKENPALRQDARAGLSLARLLARTPGRKREAIELVEEGIQRSRAIEDGETLAFQLEALAQLREADMRTTLDLLEESLTLGRERGLLRHQAIVLGRLARIHENAGNLARAIDLEKQTFELNRKRSDSKNEKASIWALNRLRRKQREEHD